MMSGGGSTPDPNLIYSLYNYTCDGTAATAINTGLYLFDSSLYPTGWDIYFDFTVESGNQDNASFLRCRNAAQPWNGFTVRRRSGNENQMHVQLDSDYKNISKTSLPGTRFIVTIEKPYSNTTNTRILIDGANEMKRTVGSVVSPLVIGGELADDTTQEWNPERFSYITIHSLIITSK